MKIKKLVALVMVVGLMTATAATADTFYKQ